MDMDSEEFKAELLYRVSLSVVRGMREQGLLTETEYHQLDTLLLKQCHPVIGTLLAGKPLE